MRSTRPWQVSLDGVVAAGKGLAVLGGKRDGEGGETRMRALDCTLDNHHLKAENNEVLFKQAREHMDEAHTEMEFGDEQLRTMVAEQAYDK
jgi:hypothetical protein